MATCKEFLTDLTDIFTGADGGGEFIHLRSNLESIFTQADNGDDASIQLVQYIERFHHLIKHLAGRKPINNS